MRIAFVVRIWVCGENKYVGGNIYTFLIDGVVDWIGL